MNMALSKAALNIIDDPDKDDDIGRKARLFYKNAYATLLTISPWNFISRRVELTRLNIDEEIQDRFRYTFQRPADAAYIFEIYANIRYSLDNASAWVTIINQYSQYLSLSHYNFLDIDGEVVDDEIRSDSPQLFAYITPVAEAPVADFSREFVDLMINMMAQNFLSQKDEDAEAFVARQAQFEKDNRKSLARAGRENQKSHFLPKATILKSIDSVRYF